MRRETGTSDWFKQGRAWRAIAGTAGVSRTLSFTSALEVGNTHRLRRHGRELLNFSTNDYLALGEAPEVRQAAAAAVLKFGTSTGASRVLAGEYELHLQLEQALARFLGTESALTFVSGHATNVTVLGTLFGPNDVVMHDQFAHNSLLEGIRLSGARRVSFRHNDLADLERRLQRLRTQGRGGRVAVCVDGVYSMEGDVAPLRGLVDLKRRYEFLLYVDDAHAVGTIGRRGAGSADAAGVDPAFIDIVMGTLGKALGSCGGFVAGRADLIEFVRWTAPGFVFSTGLPAPLAAAALAAVQLLAANPAWVADLRERSSAFRRGLSDVPGAPPPGDGTPIVPVLVDADQVFALAEQLNQAGIRVFPVTAPAVSPTGTRLRFSVNRRHGIEELQRVAATVSRTLTGALSPAMLRPAS